MKASRFTLPLVSALVALASLPASAGLRPWEPSDYVQDDLVLHYDGIRNAGADAAHDPDATTWKDLSPSGNSATLKSNGVTTYGTSGWADNGYMFYRNAWFLTDRAQSFEGDNGDFTIQAVVDFSQSAANLVSFPMVFDSSDGTTTIQAYWNNNSGQKKAYLLADKYTGASGGNASGRPYLTSAWAGHYLTAAFATASGGGKDAWIFEGTTYPTAHPGYVKGGSSSTALNAKWAFGSIVLDSGRSDRLFTGKILSIRAYSHKLTEAELAWNRALDEARFHDVVVPESAVSPAFVPDAVVATSVAGAAGFEAPGAYMVDVDGHTFRTPPCAVVSGTTYACTGCAVATWDDALGAYGPAEARDGVFAVAVAPGDKVKITWQWTAAAGSPYANPYVTDGLVLHYDGVWNAGLGVHDSSATVWKDLSASGNDAEFVYLAPGGGWLDNAYSFETNGHFQTQSTVDLGTSFTVQTVTDHSGYVHLSNTWPWFLGSADARFSVYPNSGKPHVVLNADGVIGGSHRSEFDWTNKRYLTAMMDGTSNVLFEAAARDRAWTVGSGPTPLGAQEFTIGGPSTTASFSGNNSAEDKRRARSARTPYHAVRVYNRLLTAEELAHNRAIDEARFFGNGTPASNAVLVASAVAGLEGREPAGLYFPDGWTFSAGSATNTVRGIGWTCAGYQLQTWDAESGTWSAQTSVLRNGASAVEYTAPSAPFATVRLTWLWRPVSGIRTAADYTLADYATGGTQLHLDGIEHGSAEWVWADLSGNGRDATYNGSKNGTSHWTGYGFFCNSNAVFNTAAAFSLGRHYTMQVLADASNADHTDPNRSAVFAMPSTGWGYGGIYYKGDGNKNVYHRTDSITSAAWNDMAGLRETAHMTYLTGLRDGTKVALVSGTSYPATTRTYTGEDANWYVTTGWLDGTRNDVAAAATWRIGASTAGGGADALYGTVKSVRLYDRLLSEDELAWNRRVDEARFFGRLTTTNVVLEATEWNGTLAAGPYEVFGAHVFEASPSAVDGRLPTHVRVWTLRSDGTWASAGSVEGAAYTYTPGAGTVRIQFRKSHPFVLVVR